LPSDVKNHNGTSLRATSAFAISGVLIFLQDLRIPILNQSGQVNATLLLVGAIVVGCGSSLQGFLADHIGIHHAFILSMLCYVYIIFYALKSASARRQQPT
jgi:fucose permease